MTTLAYDLTGDLGEVSEPVSNDFALYLQGALMDPGRPASPRAFAMNGKLEILRSAESRTETTLAALTAPTFYRCASKEEWKRLLLILRDSMLLLYKQILDIKTGNTQELMEMLLGNPKKAKREDRAFATVNVIPEEKIISYWYNDEQILGVDYHWIRALLDDYASLLQHSMNSKKANPCLLYTSPSPRD